MSTPSPYPCVPRPEQWGRSNCMFLLYKPKFMIHLRLYLLRYWGCKSKHCYLKLKMQNLKLLTKKKEKSVSVGLKKFVAYRFRTFFLMFPWMDLSANNKMTPAFEKIAFLAHFPKYFIVLSKSSFGINWLYSLNGI